MAVAKRKTKKTKTTAKKKKAPARRRRRDSHIKYRCILGRCTAIPKHARIGGVGDLVTLEAKRTDAEIMFRGRSPFTATRIRLRDGVPVTKRIVNRGRFEYAVTCSQCPRRLSGPPSMIVD